MTADPVTAGQAVTAGRAQQVTPGSAAASAAVPALPPPLERLAEGLDRHGPGLVLANVAMMMMLWGLGRPALWIDEAATAVAIRRSWSDLWLMLHGTDAPLVPYYLVLKALHVLVVELFPTAVAHPEVLLRWPSAVAVGVATWVLVTWLRSAASAPVAVVAGAVLLLVQGVSRYGQEARPYGLVLMAAVIATALWWRLMRTSSPVDVVVYAASVAVLGCLHALAGSLVVAHLAATLLLRRDDLPLRMLSTLCGALAGLLAAAPMTIAAVVQGGGASRYRPLTTANLLDAFGSLFDGSARHDPRVLIVVALAAVGLTRWTSDRYADITRIAAAWAVVPTLALLPAVSIQPNLLLARYVLFVVPGWAVLAGLGVCTLASLAARVAGPPRVAPRMTGAIAGAVTLGLLAGLAAVQWPALARIRTPAGHGESIRAALTVMADQPYRSARIVVPSHFGVLELAAYAPAASSRLLSLQMQNDQPDIWPQPVDRPVLLKAVRSTPTVAFLTRSAHCGALPWFLNSYRVTATTFTPGDWTVYLLHKVAPLTTVPRPHPVLPPPPPMLPCPPR